MTTDLTQATAAHLSKLFRKKKASPVEATKAILARVATLNPTVNALCVVDDKGALAAARASEKRWAKGEPLSPIDGVPVTIKELIRVRGWPTLMGSKLVDPKGPWDVDAPVPARLREAGAVLLGQSTSSEFGWKGVTDTPLHGITRNPWNLDRTPGGSSGGAAAAVAAGFGPLGIGTDGGGSVRIPANFCGLFGLKATYGRVPAWPPSLNGDMSNTGPMTRTVEDAALMMNEIARPDARDAYALPPDGVDYVAALKGKVRKLKVAWTDRFGDHPIDPETKRVFRAAVKRFAETGAELVQVKPDFGGVDARNVFVTHWLVNSSKLLRGTPAEKQALFDPGFLYSMQMGAKYTADQLVDAIADRRLLATWWTDFFAQYDLLLTPMTAVPAFPVGQNAPLGADGKPNYAWSPFSSQFNLTRHPAATVPCGFTKDGLPVGLQIVSGHWKDALILRAAARAEELFALKFPVLPR
jgi:aspartyl-tRNA(Asn)/glutamyl-tRNA(Gln) amidotransferase subunit A